MNGKSLQHLLRNEEALPGVILAAFALGMGLVGLFTVVDKVRLAGLESIEEPSSAGDERYFPDPQDFAEGDAVVKVNGTELVRADKGLVKEREDSMGKVAISDEGGWTIYQEWSAKDRSPEGDPEHYFLKTGPKQYLQLFGSLDL